MTTTATTPSAMSAGKNSGHSNGVTPPKAKASGKSKAPAARKGSGAHTGTAAPAGAGGRDLLVPLDRLVLSEANVRRTMNPASIRELAALIESQGLLHRLAVVPHGDGAYAVVAGGRRLRALQQLAQEGKWASDQGVECKLYDSERAAEVSLAENSGREAMHPADEMEAFRELVDQGLTVAQVAGRFGVSPLTVERRLKLARLAPRFIAMYRADDIEPEQLQALALTADPAAQEAAWDGLPAYDRSAWMLRRALTSQSCSAQDREALFVGLALYEARGGTVRRDLFADDGDLSSVYLDDSVLLHTLAMEKLRSAGEDVRAEGWGWVECLTEGDSMALRHYDRLPRSEREPTEAEADAIARMEAERDQLDALYARNEQSSEQDDFDPEAYEAEEARLSLALQALDAKIDAAQDALLTWSPAQMLCGGALLRIARDGTVTVDRGLMRAGAHPDGQEATNGALSSAQPAAAAGGRKKRPAISERLMRDLTAHRTGALQAALMQNTHVALVTLVHRLAEPVFALHARGNDVVKVHLTVTSDYALAQDATGYEASPAGALLSRAGAEWGDRLPGHPEALFGWLLVQDQDTLLALLAFCTARSLNAIAGRERSRDPSDAIADALGVDMADWWVPTPDNYLGAVSKATALEAVREATGVDHTANVAGMKKDAVIGHCVAVLEGTRWLPAALRGQAATTSGCDEQVRNED